MIDLLLTQDYDFQIKNGDFVVGDNQEQCVELLLMSKQGEFKVNPEAGCNLLSAKNGTIGKLLDREIRVQLEADNFKLENLKITENGIDVSGSYI